MKVGIISNAPIVSRSWKTEPSTLTSEEILRSTGGNTGNIAFVEAIWKCIGSQKHHITWGADPKWVDDNISQIVVCCANQVGKHVDLGDWSEWIRKWNKPVTLIAIGAQSWTKDQVMEVPDGTLSFLRECLNRSPSNACNISTRGEYSSAVLGAYGIQSLPMGCPSLFLSELMLLGSEIRKKQNQIVESVGIASGNPWDPKAIRIEPHLFKLLSLYPSDLILQHPDTYFKVALGELSAISDEEHTRIASLFNSDSVGPSAVYDLLKRRAVFFGDTSHWMAYMKRFDLAYGPRFHGVALAVQAGIPGHVLAIDTRTEELAKSAAIPYTSCTEADLPEDLSAMLWSTAAANQFDRNRHQKALVFKKFLQDNKLLPSRHLESICSGFA